MTDSSSKPTASERRNAAAAAGNGRRRGGSAARGAASAAAGKQETGGQRPVTRVERAKSQLARIVELFSSRELPDTLVKAYLEPTGTPSDKWSLGNRLIMAMEKTQDARGYRQWMQVGRHVKKGAKAIYILAPRVMTAVEKDKETGEKSTRRFVAGFVGVPVFRYEDTDGAELRHVKNEPRTLPPLADVAKHWGVNVRFDATRHGEYGSFSKTDSEIRLCTDEVSTFFHELAHAAHSRIEELKPGQDPTQEIVAQLVACTLARSYGYDVDGYTYGYIGHYAGGGDPETIGKSCYRVIGTVEKILGLIFEGKAERDVVVAEERAARAAASRPAPQSADAGLIPAGGIESGGDSA